MAQSSSRLLRRLNPFCAQALSAAATLCQSRGHGHITIEHWLLKLLGQGDGDLVLIGRRYEWDIEALWTGLLDHLDRLPRTVQAKPQLCDKLQRLIKNAWVHASLDEDNEQLRSAHVLAALIESPDLLACVEAWPLLSLSEVQLRHLLPLLDEHSDERPGSRPGPGLDLGPDRAAVQKSSADSAAENPVLARFTQDITDKARKGEIDPVLGRDDEIRQVIDILSRRRKNNPILVGEPGVGKTALVEGLALRIAEGNVPASLKPVSVRTLDLGLLQAGAGVKGEFEQRLKDVIEAVQQAEHPVLLFIDEAHTLIGAGNQAGSADAANLLKPALARGELRTIAATTWSEYKQYFERDPALERRFQTVKVDEPDDATAMIMLRGLKARYASHHGVHIEDAAIQAAVVLSRRYLPGRQLPDKAVDLLDTASARVRMSLDCEPQALIASKARQSALEQERQALQDDQRINGRNADERLAAIAKQLLSLRHELARLQDQHAHELDLAQTLLAARHAEVFDADTCTDLQAQLKAVQGDAPLLSLDVAERPCLSLRLTGTNGQLPRKALQSTILDMPLHATQAGLRVRNLCAPTLPCYPPSRDRFHWRVLSHLGSNFLPMLDNAEVLRGTLALYDWTGSELNRRRLEAIVEVRHLLIQRFEKGFLLRGVDIEVTLDANGFAGEGDICLFGEMLNRFFALYADIHLFTQITLILQPTGRSLRWSENHSQRIPG